MNLVARQDGGEQALLAGLGQHVRHTLQDRVRGVHVIVVHHDQHVVRRILHGQVAFGSNGQRRVHQNVLDVGHVGNQVLDGVGAVVHNHPLHPGLGIRLGHPAVLQQRNKGTTIAGQRDDGHWGQVVLLRKSLLNRIVQSALQSIDALRQPLYELGMTVLVLLARVVRDAPQVLVRRLDVALQGLDDRLHIRILELAHALRVRHRLGRGRPEGRLGQFQKGRDGRQHQCTAAGHGFIDGMPESLGHRQAHCESTLLHQRIVLLLLHHLRHQREFVGDRRGHRGNLDVSRGMDDGEGRQFSVQCRFLLLNPHVRLHQRLRVPPHVPAYRHDALGVVLLGIVLLVYGRPTHVVDRRAPGNSLEHVYGLVRLHPDLVHHCGIRKPGLVRPLGIGDPDVHCRERKQGGVDDLNEHIDLGFGGVRLEMRNVSDLRVRSQHVCKQGMQDGCVLRQSRQGCRGTD